MTVHTLHKQEALQTGVALKTQRDLVLLKTDAQTASDFDIEISGDIEAIQSDWETLEREGVLTPFQTRAWLLPLYAILAPERGATPVFVLVRDRVSRRPLMLLPLCRRRFYGITVVEFADCGVSDYNAPILARSFTPTLLQWRELWSRIKAALKEGSVLRLEKMPSHIGDLPNPLVQYGKGLKRMSFSSWGVTLPATFAAYNTQILYKTFAKEIAKKSRRIAKRGAVEYIIAQTQEEKRQAFDILTRQRQARCDEMGRKNNMAQPAYRRFYESFSVETPQSPAVLGMFKVGGEIVGITFTIRHHSSIHVIMSTYEGGDEWKSCSLGNIVMHSAIEHSIRNGVNFFDLTIGNESYKQDFGATAKDLYGIIQPLTLTAYPLAFIVSSIAYVRKMIDAKRWRNGGQSFHTKPSAVRAAVSEENSDGERP